MINLKFNAAVKALGAKWDGKNWVAPELAQQEFAALDARYNGDLVTVELTVTDSNRDSGAWLGSAHAVAIGGYVLATAYGRDSGAKVAPDIAVLSGNFTSGGSVKNYRCGISGDAVRVRCKVGRAMLTDLAVLDGIDLVELEQPQAASDADAAVQAAIALLIANGYTITKNN